MTVGPELVSFSGMMSLESDGPDTYVGIGPRYPWGGLYGGQIVAQGLRAAGLTVGNGSPPHSLHAYFIRPGDHTEPIRFEVDRIRDGRSFSTRRVVARQSIGAIFNMAASFHVPEEAVDVQPAEPDPTVAAPEDCPSDGWSHVFDRRTVGGWRADDGHAGDRREGAQAWMRITEPVDDDPLSQACALAYLSDDLPTEAAVNDHPASVDVRDEGDFGRTFMSASLDHAVWFHRRIDSGEWHLHDLRSRALTGSRGLATGEIFAADGTHAATVAQEVLLRVRR